MTDHERLPPVETTRERVDRLQLSVNHSVDVVVEWVDQNEKLQHQNEELVHEIKQLMKAVLHLASWCRALELRLDPLETNRDSAQRVLKEEEEECQNLKIGGSD